MECFWQCSASGNVWGRVLQGQGGHKAPLLISAQIFQTEAFKEAYYSPEPASMDDARALGASIEAQKESNYRRLWKAVQRERPHIIVSSLSLLGICGALAQRAVIPVGMFCTGDKQILSHGQIAACGCVLGAC